MLSKWRRYISLKKDDAIRIVEDYFRFENVKYYVKRFYTQYGLRGMEFDLGLGKNVKLFFYKDKTYVVVPKRLKKLIELLQPYVVAEETKAKKYDEMDYLLDIQIYKRKLKYAIFGMVHFSLSFVILIAIFDFLHSGFVDLTTIIFSSSLGFTLSLIIPFDTESSLIFPYSHLMSPLENVAFPILIPYYLYRLRRARERISRVG